MGTREHRPKANCGTGKKHSCKYLGTRLADKFRNQPDVTAQVAALKDVATWHRDRHMVERNFVVKSGESMTDDAIGAACINLLADLTK
jgi:hypothetical protein